MNNLCGRSRQAKDTVRSESVTKDIDHAYVRCVASNTSNTSNTNVTTKAKNGDTVRYLGTRECKPWVGARLKPRQRLHFVLDSVRAIDNIPCETNNINKQNVK